MAVIRYGPFAEHELWGLKNEIDRLFSESLARASSNERVMRGEWTPNADIYENNDHVILEIELPDVNREDIEILIEDDVITLRGERRFEKNEVNNYHRIERPYGVFLRSFKLPETILHKDVTAVYKDGLLRIQLPKGQERRARRIEIDSQVDAQQTRRDIETEIEQDKNIDFGLIEELAHQWDLLSEDEETLPTLDFLDQEIIKSESHLLYANLWMDDAEGNLLNEPIRLVQDMPYYFHIAIEPWARTGRSRPFEETEELKRNEKSTLIVEVLCPFLDEKGHKEYARRQVDYYAGYGFGAETFLLQPTGAGKYYLTARVLFNRETLYREIFTIEVVSKQAADTDVSSDETDVLSEVSQVS